MKFLYWILLVPTALGAGLLLIMGVAGTRLSAATPIWLSILAALLVLAVIAWSYRLAAQSRRPAAACLAIAAAWLAFAVVMLSNGLAQQQAWN